MLSPVPLDVNALVAGMMDMLRRTLVEQVAVTTALVPGLWTTFADPNQVESVLLNLCINARDAMAQGGALTIEAADTYIDEATARSFGDMAPGFYVVLSVADTGHGIPSEVIGRIFEPFFTTKTEGHGSGLGPRHGARIHQAVRRPCAGDEYGRERHDGASLPAPVYRSGLTVSVGIFGLVRSRLPNSLPRCCDRLITAPPSR